MVAKIMAFAGGSGGQTGHGAFAFLLPSSGSVHPARMATPTQTHAKKRPFMRS
jgi:hypothetical protein